MAEAIDESIAAARRGLPMPARYRLALEEKLAALELVQAELAAQFEWLAGLVTALREVLAGDRMILEKTEQGSSPGRRAT
jgi:hypothetical protein